MAVLHRANRHKGDMMSIGIIGAGHMALAVGSMVIKAGHRVMMSNSRGPQSLSGLRDAMGCETGSVADAAAFADIAFAAIPLQPGVPFRLRRLKEKLSSIRRTTSPVWTHCRAGARRADDGRAVGQASSEVTRGQDAELHSRRGHRARCAADRSGGSPCVSCRW